MPEAFDPYHTWLGISAEEQPANHYRLLGVSRFEDDPEVIDIAADRQMAHLRNYQTGRHQKYSQKLLNEVAAARLCLLKPATKAAYDSQLRAQLLARATPPTAQAAPQAAPTAMPVPRPAPGSAPLRQPAKPMAVAPTGDVWGNLIGDTGPSRSAGNAAVVAKAAAAKRATEKRRKMLLVAAPVAALLLIGAIVLGLMSANQSDRSADEASQHKSTVARPAEPPDHKTDASRPPSPEPKVSVRPDTSTPTSIPVPPGTTPQQPSATSPLVIDWPLDERAGAELKIDDQVRQPGQTPKFELALERGLHSVRFTRPGFSEIDQSVSIGGEAQPTIRPAWQAEDGRGLRAELFRGAHFEQHVKSRVDPLVDFLWGSTAPDPDLPPMNFSIRWSGFLKAPKAGKYKLIAAAEDEVKVSVDGVLCLQSTPMNARSEAMLDLTGEPQAIEVELCQVSPSTYVSLRWVRPGHTLEQPIPAAALFYDKQVAQKTSVPELPEPAATGGLRAQLFDDRDLRHLVKVRIDRHVDYFWGSDPPDPEFPHENYSIRWDGILQPPEAGKYTLITVADDGVRLWLDDELKVDDWKSQSATRTDVPLDLEKRAYRIRVEYMQQLGAANCNLRWIRPGATRDEPIPSSALRPPDANVVAQGKSPFEPIVFPKGEWVDVLGLVDTARDAIGGSWTRNASEITGQVTGAARLEFPVLIDGSYDLAIEFTRVEGTSDVDALIPVDWWHCGVNLSGYDGDSSGIQSIAGHSADDNPTTHRPGTLENGRRYREIISVRLLPENSASIDVSLDGKPYLPHWEGKRSSLDLHPVWSLADLKKAGLGVMYGKVTWHSVQLKMISGRAAPAYAASVRQTRTLGHPSEAIFQDLVPSGALLVGFRVATGPAEGVSATPVIHRIQPLYRNAKGSPAGPIHGGLDGDEAEVVAKEGYAVGAVVGQAGKVVDGFKVLFMRVRGDRLDPTDSYESPWLGGMGGNAPFQLGGMGGYIIGISGSAGNLLESLSLIVEDHLSAASSGK